MVDNEEEDEDGVGVGGGYGVVTGFAKSCQN
jgi:hypothetical protein